MQVLPSIYSLSPVEALPRGAEIEVEAATMARIGTPTTVGVSSQFDAPIADMLSIEHAAEMIQM